MKPKKGNASTSKQTKPPAKKLTKKTTTTSRPTTKQNSRKRVALMTVMPIAMTRVQNRRSKKKIDMLRRLRRTRVRPQIQRRLLKVTKM